MYSVLSRLDFNQNTLNVNEDETVIMKHSGSASAGWLLMPFAKVLHHEHLVNGKRFTATQSMDESITDFGNARMQPVMRKTISSSMGARDPSCPVSEDFEPKWPKYEKKNTLKPTTSLSEILARSLNMKLFILSL